MTPLLPDPDAAVRSLGCASCVSRIHPWGALPTCIYYPSGFFGAALLPITGCSSWKAREPDVRAGQVVDLACEPSERGSKQKSPGESQGLFREINGAGNTEDRLTTVAYAEGSDG